MSEAYAAQTTAPAVARKRRLTRLALIITVALWGSSFPAVRVGLLTYGPGHLALLRFLIASVAMAVYVLVTRPRMPARRDLPAIAAFGLFGVFGYHSLLNQGMVSVQAGSASLLVNTSPVFTAILAAYLLRERPSFWGWAGLAISLCGAVLIGLGEGGGLRLAPGALWLLGSAIVLSLGTIVQKPLLKRYSALEMAVYSVWCGTLWLMVYFPGLPEAVANAPLGVTLVVVYLGVFPIAVAYVAWAYVLANMPAFRAASYFYLLPVVTIFVGWAWLGEIPPLLAFLGGAMALTGVFLVNHEPIRNDDVSADVADGSRVEC
ncbi:MAG TPA: EamA family transporter [Chthonomonadales bacterium]|nr:EamA family transporter [Chthonomonadales bacterium]